MPDVIEREQGAQSDAGAPDPATADRSWSSIRARAPPHVGYFFRKSWKGVTFVLWFVLNLAPALLEAYFLRAHFKVLRSPLHWYILSSHVVVFLPTHVVPRLTPQDDWVVDFALQRVHDTTPPGSPDSNRHRIPAIQCHALEATGAVSTTWPLASPDPVEPGVLTGTLMMIAVAVRWCFPIGRILRVAKGYGTLKCCTTVRDVCLFVSLCILSIALIGTQLNPHGCIEWWAVGTHGAELFERQIGYWVINGVALSIFLVVGSCLSWWNRPPPIASDSTPPRRQARSITVATDDPEAAAAPTGAASYSWTACCFGFVTSNNKCGISSLWPASMFFFGSSFLPSLAVLFIGITKPWVLAIWLYLCVVVVDDILRPCMCRRDVSTQPTLATRRMQQRPARPRILQPEDVDIRDLDALTESGWRKRHDIVYVAPVTQGGSVYRMQEAASSTEDAANDDDVDNGPGVYPAPTEETGPDATEGRAATAPEETGSGGFLCIVCLEKTVEVIAIPCCHGVLCVDCCRGLVMQGVKLFNEQVRMHRRDVPFNATPGPTLMNFIHCPLCRSPTTAYYRLFPPANPQGRAACIWDVRYVGQRGGLRSNTQRRRAFDSLQANYYL